jgi:hypothetical protein
MIYGHNSDRFSGRSAPHVGEKLGTEPCLLALASYLRIDTGVRSVGHINAKFILGSCLSILTRDSWPIFFLTDDFSLSVRDGAVSSLPVLSITVERCRGF